MSIFKKLLLLLIFLITGICLYTLYIQRIQIKTLIKEGLNDDDVSAAQNTEFKSIEDNTSPSIGSFPAEKQNLELRQLCIKSSYNTACTGKYVNLDMVEHIIIRGCRFLDFEIFLLDGKPVVGVSSDNSDSNIESKNTLPLSKVLQRVNNFAFQSPCPNPYDPMFIHLRMKTNDKVLYKSVRQIVNDTLSNRLVSSKVNGQTKISSIMGKYVVVVDKSLIKNYNDEDVFNEIKQYNLESGGNSLRSYRNSNILQEKYSSPKISDDNINTDVVKYQMVLPDVGSNMYGIYVNPNIEKIIKNYGVQIICCSFYNKDTNLKTYENFFGNFKGGIVPLARAVKKFEEE